MKKLKVLFNRDALRALFAGPLRVRLTVERLDGTELYSVYPLGDGTIEYGQTIHLDHEIGVTITS